MHFCVCCSRVKEKEKNDTLPVVVVHTYDLSKTRVQRYHETQISSAKRYSMATLNTTHGELLVEDRVPGVAVIDTRASSIILGRAFGLHMERCQPPSLIYGDTFITAGGNSKKCIGKTKAYLTFTLAKGT